MIFLIISNTNKFHDIFYQKNQAQEQCLVLQSQNTQLKQQVEDLNNQVKQLSSNNSRLNQENTTLTSLNNQLIEENQKLSTSIISLNNQQNSLIQTLSEAFQYGRLKPSKIGFTPIFRFTDGDVDKTLQQETLAGLSQGSYNTQQEIVTFSFDDMKSWTDAGNWDLTGYRATTKECDSNPSVTASGNLVAPGFTLGVDPDYWAYGTIFYIDGLGFAIAADCGGGVGGSHRGDFLVASDIAYNVTGNYRVWVVYQPNK